MGNTQVEMKQTAAISSHKDNLTVDENIGTGFTDLPPIADINILDRL